MRTIISHVTPPYLSKLVTAFPTGKGESGTYFLLTYYVSFLSLIFYFIFRSCILISVLAFFSDRKPQQSSKSSLPSSLPVHLTQEMFLAITEPHHHMHALIDSNDECQNKFSASVSFFHAYDMVLHVNAIFSFHSFSSLSGTWQFPLYGGEKREYKCKQPLQPWVLSKIPQQKP